MEGPGDAAGHGRPAALGANELRQRHLMTVLCAGIVLAQAQNKTQRTNRLQHLDLPPEQKAGDSNPLGRTPFSRLPQQNGLYAKNGSLTLYDLAKHDRRPHLSIKSQ